MELIRVPSYLLSAVRITDPERIQEALASDDRSDPLDLTSITEIMGAWANDDDFWNSLAESLPKMPPVIPLEDSLDQERVVLMNALEGDFRLAGLILLEAPLRSTRPSPKQARQIVLALQEQCHELLAEPPSRRRTWRAARVLRRTFKAVGGGLLVAADIVAPDPTLILRTASVWGGADMIIDALDRG